MCPSTCPTQTTRRRPARGDAGFLPLGFLPRVQALPRGACSLDAPAPYTAAAEPAHDSVLLRTDICQSGRRAPGAFTYSVYVHYMISGL